MRGCLKMSRFLFERNYVFLCENASFSENCASLFLCCVFFGVYWDVLERLGVYWSVLECIAVYWNVFECIGSSVLECV